MWTQEHLPVASASAWPRLVQCREWDIGSGVFVRVLNKGRTPPGSVQGPRYRLRNVCSWARAGHSLVQWRDRDVASGVWIGGSNKGMTYIGSGQGLRCMFRSIFRRFEQRQDPAGFSAVSELRSQECFLGYCTRGGQTLSQRQEANRLLKIVPGSLNKGRNEPSLVQAPTCGFRSIYRGLEHKKDLAWFTAGTEMWVQEYLSGVWKTAGHSLHQCR